MEMASSSSSTAVSDDSDVDAPEDVPIYQELRAFLDSTNSTVDEAALWEAAAHHLTITLDRSFTAGEVREHISIAKNKKRRRRQTEDGAKSRFKAREAQRAEYSALVSTRRTRHSIAAFEEKHGSEPAPLQPTARSASTATFHACSMVDAYNQLLARSKPPSTKKKSKKGKEEAVESTATHRQPLSDISNQQQPDALDDSNQPVDSASDSASSSSTSTSVPSSAPSAALFSTPPHSTGLLSAKARITVAQHKKDLKHALAVATAEQVDAEMNKQKLQGAMLNEAVELFAMCNRRLPSVFDMLERMAEKYKVAESKQQ